MLIIIIASRTREVLAANLNIEGSRKLVGGPQENTLHSKKVQIINNT